MTLTEIPVQILIIAGVVTVLLGLNILASVRCLRFVLSPGRERIAQLCLVWLLPLIGALIVLHMLRTGDGASPGRYSRDAAEWADDAFNSQGGDGFSSSDTSASDGGGGGH